MFMVKWCIAERFVVLSYNLLADYLAINHRSKLYFHIPHYMLEWKWRKKSIIFELGLWSADIMCLQVKQCSWILRVASLFHSDAIIYENLWSWGLLSIERNFEIVIKCFSGHFGSSLDYSKICWTKHLELWFNIYSVVLQWNWLWVPSCLQFLILTVVNHLSLIIKFTWGWYI